MPLGSLYDESAQAAYDAACDLFEFHAQLIAITQKISVDDAFRRMRAVAEEAYLLALAGGADA